MQLGLKLPMLFRLLLTLLVIVRDAGAGQRSPKISLGGEGSRIVLPLEKEQCTSICDEVHIAIHSIWLNIFFLQTVALLRLEMSWQDHPQLSTRTHCSPSNHRLGKAVVDRNPIHSQGNLRSLRETNLHPQWRRVSLQVIRQHVRWQHCSRRESVFLTN
jgi:hypothetical protein